MSSSTSTQPSSSISTSTSNSTTTTIPPHLTPSGAIQSASTLRATFCGIPDPRLWEFRAINLEPIRAKLLEENIISPNHSVQSLSNLVLTLMKFQEQFLGLNGPKPRNLTRLPSAFFTDGSPTGPLAIILKIYFQCLKSLHEHSGVLLNVLDANHLQQSIIVFKQMTEALYASNYLSRPKIHLHPTLPTNHRGFHRRIVQIQRAD